MAVADYPVNGASDITAAYIAYDCTICRRESFRVPLKPLVVLDDGFNTAARRNSYAHASQLFSGALQECEILLGSAFPKMDVKRLVTNDFRPRREVDDFAGHKIISLVKVVAFDSISEAQLGHKRSRESPLLAVDPVPKRLVPIKGFVGQSI
jgi:hypothetical protein